jgi:hypothetical protein
MLEDDIDATLIPLLNALGITDEAMIANMLECGMRKDHLGLLKAMKFDQPDGFGLKLPTFISPEQVKPEAKTRSTNIFRNWDMLNAIVQRHEAVIRKRWKKRTIGQRKKVLETAWGGPLPSNHRPDFDAIRKETDAQRRAGTHHREAFMWPYINLEDLTKLKTLLLFLNSRGRHAPDEFAAADYDAIHLGLVSNAIMPVWLSGGSNYVMLLGGRVDADSYGELVNCDEHKEASVWQNGKEVVAGKGVLILEIQDRIVDFLLKSVREILADFSETQLLDSDIPLEPPAVSETESGFPSLAILAEESPYRVPAQLDMGRIVSLLAARRDQAADHLWSLREDPNYFMHEVKGIAEHDTEQQLGIRGQARPILHRSKRNVPGERVVAELVNTSYLRIEIWSGLESQAKALGDMHQKYGPTLSTLDHVPKDFLHALLTFRYWLKGAADLHILALEHAITASESFRDYFELEAVTDPAKSSRCVVQKSTIKLKKVQEEILWLVALLRKQQDTVVTPRITTIVDELQRLLNTKYLDVQRQKEGITTKKAITNADKLISEYVAALIADMSIFSECLHQIDLFQPWASSFLTAEIHHEQHIADEFSKTTESWKEFARAFTREDLTSLVHLIDPGKFDFRYPIEARRTKENVAAMRVAEKNLDRFWARVDDITRRKAGTLTGTATGTLLKGGRTLQRTAEWVEPENSATRTETVPELERPLSELYLDLQYRTERTTTEKVITKEVKAKRKTRGEADLPSTTTHLPAQPETNIGGTQPASSIDRGSQPTFHIDALALKVFETLFYTPSLTDPPGGVTWTDFLHALASIGFGAEKLYGSVWQFSPTKLDVERAIQFHEPHPSRKLPFFKARRYGRRLNRAYGWYGGMFVLAEKT